MPLYEIKIDKSFITNMMNDEQNQAIVHTTIELAHHMNLRVVAEGIEDEETLRLLSDMGCEEAQGYCLSKPVPSTELVDWLENRERVSYAERRRSKRAFAKKA
jgi:EAL domain-containing protein (putative c-di-GMP-specific phosphodiesterase class I)